MLAERYPGKRVRVMVRDRETLYVYWETDEDGFDGFEVKATARDGARLAGFATGGSGSGGYLRVPAHTVGTVEVCPVRSGTLCEPIGTVTFGMPPVQRPTSEARWVDTREAPPAQVAAPEGGPQDGELPGPPPDLGRPLSSLGRAPTSATLPFTHPAS